MRKISQYFISLDAQRGRIKLKLTALKLGADYALTLHGGRAHVGSTALAAPGQNAQICQIAGHRDGEIAASVAERVANALQVRVAVTCGIHYDAITREEIAQVRELAGQLAVKFTTTLGNGNRCGEAEIC